MSCIGFPSNVHPQTGLGILHVCIKRDILGMPLRNKFIFVYFTINNNKNNKSTILNAILQDNLV